MKLKKPHRVVKSGSFLNKNLPLRGSKVPSSAEKLSNVNVARSDIGVAILVLTSALYVTGLAYHRALLSAFSIGVDQVSKDTNMYLLDGYNCFFALIATRWGLGLFVCIFLIFVFTIIAKMHMHRFILAKRFSEKTFNSVSGLNKVYVAVIMGCQSFYGYHPGRFVYFHRIVSTIKYFYGLLFTLIIYLLAITSGGVVGHAHSAVLASSETVSVEIGEDGRMLQFVKIYCGDSRCAFYEPRTQKAYVYGNEQMKVVVTQRSVVSPGSKGGFPIDKIIEAIDRN